MSEEPKTFVLLALLFASALSIVGLTALWTALGRGHWFLRFAVLAGLIALTLPIEAYDLLLVFYVQAGAVIAVLLLCKTWQRRRNSAVATESVESVSPRRVRPSISLKNLLLLVTAASVVFATISRVPQEVWLSWDEILPHGLLAAVVTLLAMWVALSSRKALPRALMFCAAAVLGAAVAVPTMWGPGIYFPEYRWPCLLTSFCLSLLIVAWLTALRYSSTMEDVLGGVSARLSSIQEPKPERSGRLAVAALGVLSGSIIIPLAVVYYQLIQLPPPIPEVTLPDPNGFDELLRIATEIYPDEIDADTATPAMLRTFVTQHQPLFDDAREALNVDSRVPVKYVMLDESSFDAVVAYRSLARGLMIEGNIAEQNGAMPRAAESYLTIVRLGQTLKFGGLITAWLVGAAIENIGLTELVRLRTSLNANECRKLIRDLDPLGLERETMKDVAHRDWIWDQNVFPWHVRLLAMLNPPWNAESWLLPHMEATQLRRHATRRLLMCDLAVRAYKSDEGRLPQSLDGLVGKYLPEMPLDPFTGKPFVFRTTDKGYQLYSLGEDGDDDGGQPAVDNMGPGDFTLQ